MSALIVPTIGELDVSTNQVPDREFQSQSSPRFQCARDLAAAGMAMECSHSAEIFYSHSRISARLLVRRRSWRLLLGKVRSKKRPISTDPCNCRQDS